MWNQVSEYGDRFVLTITVTLLLAALGVGILTYGLVHMVTTGANNEDHERTRQIVHSALRAEQVQLANTATDNSYWDDAVRNLYEPVNMAWVAETYGAPGVNYDVMMVVDRDIPEPVIAFRLGEKINPGATAGYFQGRMEAFLDVLAKESPLQKSRADIFSTADGLAIAGVAPILPFSENLEIKLDKPRYMILLKFLTPNHVATIGEQYVIPGLAVKAAGGAGTKGTLISDFTGVPVAEVDWIDRRPGDRAGAAVLGNAVFLIGFLLVILAIIAVQCWRLIVAIREREAAARHQAMHDTLTGLPNRAALRAEIDKLSVPGGPPVAVAFADLDGFKDVNDAYDHATGDRLIQEVAARLTQVSGDGSTVYRLGGDEFVMLFRGQDVQVRASVCADGFISALAQPFYFDGRIIQVGVSVGIASNENNKLDGLELMRRADIAMYKAKQRGRNRFLVFDAEYDTERAETQNLSAELRRIIASSTDGSRRRAAPPAAA